MQQVTVEDQCISGIELTIDQWHGLKCVIHHHHIGTDLFTSEAMVNTTELMRTFDHLQATILFVRLGECNHYADQLIGKHELIFIPVTIILVPLPSSTNARFFLHELRMKVTNGTVAIQQRCNGVDHPLAPCHVTEYIVARSKPKRESCFLAGLIVEVECILTHHVVGDCGRIHLVDFRFAEEILYDDITIAVKIVIHVVFHSILID